MLGIEKFKKEGKMLVETLVLKKNENKKKGN